MIGLIAALALPGCGVGMATRTATKAATTGVKVATKATTGVVRTVTGGRCTDNDTRSRCN